MVCSLCFRGFPLVAVFTQGNSGVEDKGIKLINGGFPNLHLSGPNKTTTKKTSFFLSSFPPLLPYLLTLHHFSQTLLSSNLVPVRLKKDCSKARQTHSAPIRRQGTFRVLKNTFALSLCVRHEAKDRTAAPQPGPRHRSIAAFIAGEHLRAVSETKQVLSGQERLLWCFYILFIVSASNAGAPPC